MPSDSLSRDLAANAPVDTLRLVWRTTGEGLAYPRTVRFGPAGRLFVGDVERNAIFILNEDGSITRRIDHDTFDAPYLAGVWGDTLAVFSPASLRLDLLAGNALVERIVFRDDDRTRSSLVYAAFGSDVYYKRVGPDGEGIVARMNRAGRIRHEYALSGPHWRHAGLLRTWGDTLMSLSGYRPVVDLIAPNGRVDTLALHGFDSPMLARSRSFMLGEVHQPPLLSSSAAAAGDLLFVVNLRAGWLEVDVFGRDGRLQRRLVEGRREYLGTYFPHDLDARRLSDGTYLLAVVLSEPEPRVELFTWSPAE